MSMPLLVPPLNRPTICPEAGHRKLPAAAPGEGEAATFGAFESPDLPAAAERVELPLRFGSAFFARAFGVSLLAATSDFAVAESARETDDDEEEARERGGSFGDVPHATTSMQTNTPKATRRPGTVLELWGMFGN